LRDAIEPLRDRFQFIVLDCPPALDLLTLNSLVAADSVLIPMQAEYFALEGISELLDTVERIRAGLNPELAIEGVVLTMLDDRTSLAKQVMAELRKYFGDKLCATSIPRNIRLAEAPSHGKPALLYDVRSRGAESYIRLAKEIIAHYFAQAEAAIEAAASGEVAREEHPVTEGGEGQAVAYVQALNESQHSGETPEPAPEILHEDQPTAEVQAVHEVRAEAQASAPSESGDGKAAPDVDEMGKTA
jgi:hypothetical protein